jgi:hypothetical protein
MDALEGRKQRVRAAVINSRVTKITPSTIAPPTVAGSFIRSGETTWQRQ